MYHVTPPSSLRMCARPLLEIPYRLPVNMSRANIAPTMGLTAAKKVKEE